MAQTIVGHSLLEGKGQPYFGNGKPDPENAFSWFQKSYKQGYLYAGAYLAYCHWKGAGTEQDPKKAIALHRLLADKGNARSQALLGGLLLHGEDIPKDLQAAHRYLRKAAEQDDVLGLNAFAACLFQGVGITPNPGEAVRLFQRAAALESADAQAILGACYEEGKGVEKDPPAAFSWYLLAARNGNAIAQGRIGLFLMQGTGCRENQTSGLAWLRLAAKNGDKQSKEAVEAVENYLRDQDRLNQEMEEEIAALREKEELLIRDAERIQQVRNGERRSHNGFTAKDLRGF
jgi:TPR repeat protein